MTVAQTPTSNTETIARTPANPALPSLFLVGDSTADQSVDRLHEGFSGVQGWGVLFPAFFEASRTNVVDVARGGRSSRTFITEGFWDTALTSIKSGDIVLIQLGQNDVFAVNDDTRQFEKFGQAKTFGLFHDKEPAHMNTAGSFFAAACVLAGLKDVPDLSLDSDLTTLGHLTPDAATLALPTLPVPKP